MRFSERMIEGPVVAVSKFNVVGEKFFALETKITKKS